MLISSIKRKAFPTQYSKYLAKSKEIQGDLKRKIGFDALSLPRDIPKELDEFYKGFDPIVNTDTMEQVTELADHQREVWNDQYKYIYRAYPKSQKIFLSTTFIFEDIRHALTDCMGMEIIISAQSETHAQNHLNDFKKYVMTSRYKDYLITKPIPEIGLSRNEVTKSTMALLHNPDNPFFPTRVYAIGASAGALISYKKVKHVHASDITRSKETPEKQKETIASMVSRLAISKGSMVLEAPFRGMEGPLFDQWEKYNNAVEKGLNLAKLSREQQRAEPFYCKAYDYTYGLQSGAFDEAFIAGERIRQGNLFDMYYGAKPYQSDMSWFLPEMFKSSDEADSFFASGK